MLHVLQNSRISRNSVFFSIAQTNMTTLGGGGGGGSKTLVNCRLLKGKIVVLTFQLYWLIGLFKPTALLCLSVWYLIILKKPRDLPIYRIIVYRIIVKLTCWGWGWGRWAGSRTIRCSPPYSTGACLHSHPDPSIRVESKLFLPVSRYY